jgi:hypothetical protein
VHVRPAALQVQERAVQAAEPIGVCHVAILAGRWTAQKASHARVQLCATSHVFGSSPGTLSRSIRSAESPLHGAGANGEPIAGCADFRLAGVNRSPGIHAGLRP